MGLGSVHDVSLAEARQEAERCRKLVRQGLDPIAQRREKFRVHQIETATRRTFEQCAVAYVASKPVK